MEFPHPDMPGYTYKGYQFDGISGSYTTLTEELFNKLAAAGKTVSATATFSAIATPAPAAAPEATAAPTATPAPTPDDSQYYTCKDCGHHNWTATADGYKCDTCGRIETKQLSGYKNVKGTYTPDRFRRRCQDDERHPADERHDADRPDRHRHDRCPAGSRRDAVHEEKKGLI